MHLGELMRVLDNIVTVYLGISCTVVVLTCTMFFLNLFCNVWVCVYVWVFW